MIMRRFLPLLLLLFLSGQCFAQAASKDELRKTIFFAVLEGLYREGVSDSTVDELLKLDAETGRPVYFVYGCPICIPVYDALSVYRTRPVFYRDKGRRRDFSTTKDLEKSLSVADRTERALGLQKMVFRMLESRLKSQRLTAEERTAWDQLLDAASDEGGKLLENYPEQAAWMKSCPSCSGATGADI